MNAPEALFSKSRAAVLALLFVNPERRLFLSELMDQARVGTGAVQRELERLLKVGLVVRSRVGRRRYYQANPHHYMFNDLVTFVQRSLGPAGQIRSRITELASGIRLAFIFGSIAAGDETFESDVDLLVVGKVSFDDVIRVLIPVQNEIGREVNPSLFSVREFKKRVRDSDPFLTRVLDGQKLWVLGGEDVLERLV